MTENIFQNSLKSLSITMKKLHTIMLLATSACYMETTTVESSVESSENFPDICGVSQELSEEERLRLITGEELLKGDYGTPRLGKTDLYSNDHPNRLTLELPCSTQQENCVDRYTMILVPISAGQYGVCFITKTQILEDQELTPNQLFNMSQFPTTVTPFLYGPKNGSCVVREKSQLMLDGEWKEYDLEWDNAMIHVACGGPWDIYLPHGNFSVNKP